VNETLTSLTDVETLLIYKNVLYVSSLWLDSLIAVCTVQSLPTVEWFKLHGIIISRYFVVSWHRDTQWPWWYWYWHVWYHDTYRLPRYRTTLLLTKCVYITWSVTEAAPQIHKCNNL